MKHSNIFKSLVVFALVVSLIPAGSFAARAEKSDDTKALIDKIDALKAQIQALQQQQKQQKEGATEQIEIEKVPPALPTALPSQPQRPIVIPAGQQEEQQVPSFDNDLYFGMKSSSDVKDLQEFLIDQGFYAGSISGNFFVGTLQAVKKFQSAHGLKPTGYFGPKTRAVANEIIAQLVQFACPSEEGCEGNILPTKQLNIKTNSDLRGVVGDKFYASFNVSGGNGNYSIEGGGDTPPGLSWSTPPPPCLVQGETNSCVGGPVVMEDRILLQGTPEKSGSYNVTVFAKEIVVYPPCMPDVQCVTPIAKYGKESFTVIIKDKGGIGQPPVINGVKGPTKLKVGEEGTWTVNASDPYQGNLSYSVTWGDEIVYPVAQGAPAPVATPSFVQTATFVHTYATAGVYTPLFRVVNEKGLEAKTSLSVSVGDGGSTNHSPRIYAYPAVPTNIQVGQAVNFSWSATDEDMDRLSWSVSWGDGNGEGGVCQVPVETRTQGRTRARSSFLASAVTSITVPTPTPVAPPVLLQDPSWRFSTSHAWSVAGTYTVSVSVSDCKGGSDKSSFTVNVVGGTPTNHAPKIVGLTAVPTNIKPGQTVSFSWSATDADNDDLSWSVDWGEGIGSAGVCRVNPPSGTGQNWNYTASYAWSSAGTYTVKVTVSDCKGGSDSSSFAVTVGTTTTQPAVTVTADSQISYSTQLPMGTAANILGAFKIANTVSNESVGITDVVITPTLENVAQLVQPGFNNVQLWNGVAYNGGTFLANGILTWIQSAWVYRFHFAGPLFVSPGQSVSLVLRGDVPAAGTIATIKDGLIYHFAVANTGDVVANGQTSNSRANVVFGSPAPISASFTVTMGSTTNTAPKITGVSAVPTNIQPGQAASFSWSATDANNDDLSWSVDWGEGIGSAGVCRVNPPSGTGQNWNYTASYAWSRAGTYTVKVTVSDCKGGSDSTSFTVNVGQTVTVAPSLTIASDPSTPGLKQLSLGSAGNSLLSFRISADSIDDVAVSSIKFMDVIINNAGGVSFKNLKLFDGGAQIGSTAASLLTGAAAGTTSAFVTFNLPTPLVVAKGTSKTLTLKGDVGLLSEGAVVGSSHIWGIGSGADVAASGYSSKTTATVSGTAVGSSQIIVVPAGALITVFPPPATTDVFVGSPVFAQWVIEGYDPVKTSIQLKNAASGFTREMGIVDAKTCGKLGAGTPNYTCSLTWTVPTDVRAGSGYQFRVYDQQANVAGESPVFTIRALTVVY